MPDSLNPTLAKGERHYDELAALYEIAALSASRGDRSDLIDRIVHIVREVIAAERVLLFTYDSDTAQLRLHQEKGLQGDPFPASTPGLISRVLHGRSAELTNQLTDEEEGDAQLRTRAGAYQVVATPLLLGDQVLGVLAGVNSLRGSFRPDDLRVLSILGDRIAVTLENAHLLRSLQRQVGELEGLQRLSRLLTSGVPLEQVIDESIRITAELIDCDKIALLLYDEESDELVAQRPAIGIQPEQLRALRLPVAEPSMGSTVFRTNTPMSSNDAPSDAWVSKTAQQLLDIQSLLVVPLASGPRPVGVLKLINARDGQFDEVETNYASLLGRQIGAILESHLSRTREQALVRRLRDADRTKSEFVSMLAHELKGPMTTVLGFSHTLREQWDRLEDAKREQVLEIINKEVARLSRLVNDLLDVTRMEAGTLRYELEPTELQEIIDSLLVVHTSLRVDHLVTAELPKDLPKVMADKDRIRQVIINLLTNATRYSPAGTYITIDAEEVEEQGQRFVRVSVRDEGIGIAPEDAERVFAKFAMLPKPGWTKKGTGLGLFITRAIIHAMGGRIWVKSQVGKGATFYFTLRVAEDAAAGA
ncbi:MAG: ATP-binding protein [Actinomycetota bacterium]|nr:ATP-binding protein [Actinomycetota bacterium]